MLVKALHLGSALGPVMAAMPQGLKLMLLWLAAGLCLLQLLSLQVWLHWLCQTERRPSSSTEPKVVTAAQ